MMLLEERSSVSQGTNHYSIPQYSDGDNVVRSSQICEARDLGADVGNPRSSPSSSSSFQHCFYRKSGIALKQ